MEILSKIFWPTITLIYVILLGIQIKNGNVLWIIFDIAVLFSCVGFTLRAFKLI
jgi:hypothetical protein